MAGTKQAQNTTKHCVHISWDLLQFHLKCLRLQRYIFATLQKEQTHVSSLGIHVTYFGWKSRYQPSALAPRLAKEIQKYRVNVTWTCHRYPTTILFTCNGMRHLCPVSVKKTVFPAFCISIIRQDSREMSYLCNENPYTGKTTFV